MTRGSKFGFEQGFDDCSKLQKQLEAFHRGETSNVKNGVDLALQYAHAQTHMVEEFSALIGSCQMHANLHQQENNNIHGDVKTTTYYMNECADLVRTTFGLRIQHQDDINKIEEFPESETLRINPVMQSLLKESQKKLNLDHNFMDTLIFDGKAFVLKSMNQETPSSEQATFLLDPLINLLQKGNDFFRSWMNRQPPSSEHSKILFKNILNLYEIEYAQFLARHTLELVETPSVCLSQELEQRIKKNARNTDFSKMLQANTLSKTESKKSIESHQALTSGDSTINQKLTRLIVQAMAFATMFLTIDTASKTSDENIEQFKTNLAKVLENYIGTMKFVQKEKNVYYANNTQISEADIEQNIISIVTTRVTNQIQLEYNTILKKIQQNPHYTSWDLHFFTDEYVPEIVNDEPDSADAANAMQDYEAESFMAHRVIDAIIAFDVIPNVLKSKWTDVRGTPPIKTYPMPTSDDMSNVGSTRTYHTSNDQMWPDGNHIPWSHGNTFPGEVI